MQFVVKKSNLKFLEFSSNEIPCVCSNVENYAKTVKHGETGLLAKNTKESWYENLNILIKDEELRKTISKNAASFVRNNFDIKDKVTTWFEVYNKVLE